MYDKIITDNKIITSEHNQRIKNKGPSRKKECGGKFTTHVRKVHERHLDIIFSHIILVRRATT